MDVSMGDSGLVELVLSWTSSVVGGIWYLWNCSRCSSPWYLATIAVLAAFSASYYLATRLAKESRKRCQVLLSSLLIGTVSLFILRSFGSRSSHDGHRCGVQSAASFLTPSGVEVPLSSIDNGRPDGWVPTIEDPEAIDPQEACDYHRVSNIKEHEYGLTADLDLQGQECNVYGRDVPELKLVVEYQAKDRLHVEILPRYMGPQNESWFVLYEELIPKPKIDEGYDGRQRDLEFELHQGSRFGFSVKRADSGETVFTTDGSKLVFEDQFIELKTSMPENYNVYGLGEVMSHFRLGNNFTSMFSFHWVRASWNMVCVDTFHRDAL